MTDTLTASAAVRTEPEPPATTPARQGLRAVAIVACLPYITLKIAWLAGSYAGIPEGSKLREPDQRNVMIAFNGLSVVMDAAVVVLALLLTRPWGRRVPAWLLALPLWGACGLLAPIMTGFPAQLLLGALGYGSASGSGSGSGQGGDRAAEGEMLADWVFGLVYGGFILQGLALGTLFVLYARDRWGHLWRGRLADLPDTPRSVQRFAAAGAALLALLPAATHLLWASGSTTGLSKAKTDDRAADFYVLEALYASFALAAAAGVLMLVFRVGGRIRLPLGLAWVGSGATACWGGWLTLAALPTPKGDPQAPTQLMNVTYAVQMVVGLLILTVGAYFFAERAAERRTP